MMRNKARNARPARAKKVAKAGGKSRPPAGGKRTKSRPGPRVQAAQGPEAALVEVTAQALNLPLDPAWRGGVAFNLGLILRLAKLVDEFPLPDDTEPGPVFHA